MNEIIAVVVEQLVRDYGCSGAAMIVEHDGTRTELSRSGEPGAPDDAVTLTSASETVIVELTFAADAAPELRREARILAESLANGYASLRIVREAETSGVGRILIVDDDLGVRTLVRHVLQRDGFTVLEAPDGLVGHARALEFRPDLIIIDWMMPTLDGHDAVVRLKADPFTAAIPIVMLTSRSEPGDKIAALQAGVQDFLTKPFEPATLTRSVRQQLRWRRLLADERAGVVPVAAPRPAAAPDSSNLAGFIEIAEVAEERNAYDDAADAYARAAEIAASVVNPDVGNKFMRLCGKMYLLLAESATDPAVVQRGYTQAARAFLAAGNLSLATSSDRLARGTVNAIS